MSWDVETNIKGPPGQTGAKGDTGATGTPGAPGATGPQGPQGAHRADRVRQGASGSGAGDVVGPAGAVADRIAVYNGTTGKIIKDGGKLIADLAPVSIPVFTGDPQAPTPATADSDTSIATTAFVKAQSYATSASVPVPATATPLAGGGAGAVGIATKYAREDHVHPAAAINPTAWDPATVTNVTLSGTNLVATHTNTTGSSGPKAPRSRRPANIILKLPSGPQLQAVRPQAQLLRWALMPMCVSAAAIASALFWALETSGQAEATPGRRWVRWLREMFLGLRLILMPARAGCARIQVTGTEILHIFLIQARVVLRCIRLLVLLR